eukprot:TRINITY_DN18717_c0_g1_i4.p1 TRINITY_DN18717_c0_g1~~TRINITY_DN18717_c0_g1_i4.p1  ORF type:complete len:179 (+),score=56.29 TRINITY_DN18717_c0_g1_i4:154-690(+)
MLRSLVGSEMCIRDRYQRRVRGRRSACCVRQRAPAMPPVLFEDIFEITEDPTKDKKFDRVSRLVCRSENYEMEMTLDMNTDIYPLHLQDRFTMVLVSSVSLDEVLEDDGYDQSGRPTLLDKYEYAMYGKLFNNAQDDSGNLALFASFGGLLMKLKGDPSSLDKLKLDTRIYLLMRKVK